MSRFSEVDVAVVGAGAAGLAAARTLHEAGRSTLILEARDRIGGRARTIPGPLGSFIDLGCEWLHSGDVNPWTDVATTLGHPVNRHCPDWSERLARREGAEAQAAYLTARRDYYQQIEAFADGRADCALAELLEPGFRWTGIFDAVNTWITGTELARTSAREQALYADSGVNWRLPRGYGSLIAEYGEGLPIALSCPVTAVDSTGALITLETPQGTVRCTKLILTLPPNLLLSGAIRFTPTLPQSVLSACEGLPLGLANKLYFHLSAPIDGVAANAHFIGRTDSVETAGYEVMPQGRPLVSVYVGGRFAHSLEDAGPEAFADFAITELTELFGSDIRTRLTPLASSAWASDPWAGGSYSHALPGRYEDRLILAQPVDGRIFFAGEASHATDFSTAHGAYKTGLRAAAAALES